MTNAFAVTSAEAGVRKSCGQANSSSPRKAGAQEQATEIPGFPLSRERRVCGGENGSLPTVLTCGSDNIELP
jgi:hypothetical protein